MDCLLFDGSLTADEKKSAVVKLQVHKKEIDDKLKAKWEDIPIYFTKKDVPDWWKIKKTETSEDVGHGGLIVVPHNFQVNDFIHYMKENVKFLRTTREQLRKNIREMNQLRDHVLFNLEGIKNVDVTTEVLPHQVIAIISCIHIV